MPKSGILQIFRGNITTINNINPCTAHERWRVIHNRNRFINIGANFMARDGDELNYNWLLCTEIGQSPTNEKRNIFYNEQNNRYS